MSAVPAGLPAAPTHGVTPGAASALFATYGSPAQPPATVSAQPTARAVDALLAAGDPIPNLSLGGSGLGYWSLLEDAADGRSEAQSGSDDSLGNLDLAQDGVQRLQTLDDVMLEAGQLIAG